MTNLTKYRRNKWRTLVVSLAVMVALTGCGSGGTNTAEPSEPPVESTDGSTAATNGTEAGASTKGTQPATSDELDTVRLLQAAPSSIVFNVLFVGNELGYFADEGIVVEDLDAGELTEVAFLDNGQADIAFTGPPEILQGIEAGVDLKVIYEFWQTAIEGIVVSEESDIEDMSDLEGGVVGLASEADRAVLNVALDAVGLTNDSVEVIIVGDSGGVIASALQEGSIDAFVGSTRDFRNLVAAGEPIRAITPEEIAGNPGESFIALSSTISEQEDVLARFFRAWAKSTYAALQNDDVLVAMAEIHAPESVQDPAIIPVGLEQAKTGNAPLTEAFGEVRPDVWERVVSQLVDTGDISGDVDIANFLDDRFIAPANDFDKDEVEADVAAWAEDNL